MGPLDRVIALFWGYWEASRTPRKGIKHLQCIIQENFFSNSLFVIDVHSWIDNNQKLTCPYIITFNTEIKNLGLEAGLAFDIDTPLGNIPNECDLILLMARKAGFSHCPLDNRIYQKIVDAKKYGKKVAIDGGVDPNNFFKIKKSGADLIYSGQSFLDLINQKEN